MKYILLCGGSGQRLQSPTCFPKPLNHVLGIHSIQYVLESIESDEIYVIANKGLYEYQFDKLLQHLVKKKLHIAYLDRSTRGPVETAYLGLQKLNISADEQICFFDNDTIYDLQTVEIPKGTWIGISHLQSTEKQRAYCYVKTQNNVLREITEKIPISTDYACGLYGFSSAQTFFEISKELLTSDTTFNNEYYMSLLYQKLLQKGEEIHCVSVPNTVCLGTHDDIKSSLGRIPFHPLRICFDIDNTLLTYRNVGETYRDCKPIDSMVSLVKKLKEIGHTIILHTARGMKSNRQNAGAAMKSVAQDTFSVLERFNIPFDEIYFGKPDADLYIDDKAFNPYISLYKSIGFEHLEHELQKAPTSEQSSNKYNTLCRNGDVLTKTGPSSSMNGEVFFYKSVAHTNIATYFPKFHGSTTHDSTTSMTLEYIDGYTIFDILKDDLLSPNHLHKIIVAFEALHSFEGLPITISKEAVYQNYMGKLYSRSKNTKDYPFENTRMILDTLNEGVSEYLKRATLVSIVHGDPWFSNTLLKKDNSIIFLDMKGDINGTLTTNGDALTDYGKMYQSLLGFDYIMNGIEEYNTNILHELQEYFLSYLVKKGYTRKDIYAVTGCLIGKTLSFMDVDRTVRTKVWNIVEMLAKKYQEEITKE